MSVALGFLWEPVSLPFESILPSRKLPEASCPSKKYQQIRASIEAVGLIEPLTVTAAHSGVTFRHIRATDFRRNGATKSCQNRGSNGP